MSSEKFFKQLFFVITLVLVLFFFYQLRDLLIPWVLFIVIIWMLNLIPIRTARMREKKFQFIMGLTIILVIYIFIQFSDIFVAFLIALVLAYIIDPLVDLFEKWKMSRTFAILTLIFIFAGALFLILVLIIPKINHDINSLKKNLPTYYEELKVKAEPMIEKYTPYLEKYIEAYKVELTSPDKEKVKDDETISIPVITSKHIQKLLPYIRTLFVTLFNILNTLTRFFIGLFAYIIIPVLVFHLLKDIDTLKKWVKDSIPIRFRESMIKIVHEINQAIGNYIRGVVIESILVGLCVWIGLQVFGFNYALLFGILAAVFFFIPYVGAIFWIVPAFIVGFSQFTLLKTVLVIFGLNMFVYNVFTDLIVTPIVMGKSMKMHPVIIILSLLFFGKILGFFGVIVAIPMAGILQILFGYFYAYYKESEYFKKQTISGDLGAGNG